MNVEFSRPFPVDKLRATPTFEKIEANEEECAALAARLEIVAIKSLEAKLELNRLHSGDMVEVKGSFNAEITQECVVTLEPFEDKVSEEIVAYFAAPETIPSSEELNVEDDRSPEPYGPDRTIDLGELVAQHLSLALDPYPRKPGVVFKLPKTMQEEVAQTHPFSVLVNLKDKKKDK